MSSTETSQTVSFQPGANPFFGRLLSPLGALFDPKDHLRRRIFGEMSRFRQKINIAVDSRRYQVRTAESRSDLEAAFRLRHDVFYEELMNRRHWLGLDVDSFDFLADHLLVVEKETKRVVGTYRILSSSITHRFYSETEFMLDEFKKRSGTKIELGRACVDKHHRNGLVLTLLWRGVHQYAQISKADSIFGCSSVSITHPFTVACLARFFREGQVSDQQMSVRPREDHRIVGYSSVAAEVDKISGLSVLGVRSLVPPLLLSYFKAGAKVASEPALDRAFQCVDFFTVLETAHLQKLLERRLSHA